MEPADETRERLSEVAAQHDALRLLVLFGSRARADAGAHADWDFGYLADRDFDPLALYAQLVEALATERIDLVDLERANGLLRFRAARDGVAIHDRDGETWPAFWLEAVDFWCDAGPVIREAYGARLARL